MKIIFTLALLIGLSISAHAQFGQTLFNLDFRDTTVINQVFYTDSIIDSLGIWQIGTPGKPFFDSSFGIVTGLDSALPANTKASFVVTLPTVNYLAGSILVFTHKYDFDSSHSGGYIEFSVDTGQHWHGVYNYPLDGGYYYYFGAGFCVFGDGIYSEPMYIDGQVIFPPVWWSGVPYDTTATGIAYLTGSDSIWRTDTIVMPTSLPEKTNQLTQYMFRWTAFADSNAVPKAGWMIDSITYIQNFIHCVGGINEINSSHIHIYPDPVAEAFTVSLADADIQEYTLSIIDLTGRPVMSFESDDKTLELKRNGIAAGSYILQVRDHSSGNTLEKMLVFE